ncbi:hypothetical protein [Citrobacter portucalensis]|uniref:hypothetical protein n=1 Tax=Citrobacter portucalensis TaxID=1639133 RepID=UPI0024333E13|nr:hypothetical protein [Citrobacter portucalensis]WFZ31437.1 hypothetical protein NFK62_11735 [Citrobacter portucalensis]WFZ36438.1 hypothetical protein NFK63_11725 [Citrobacter portucalensis]
MTTITKERVAEIIHAAGLEPCDYEEVFGSIKTGEIVAMARIALASLESEAVGEVVLGEYDDCGCHPDARVVCIAADGQADWENFKDGTRLYAAPPSLVEIDEREAFNAWNNDENLPIAGVGAKNAAWLAWQARAAMLQSFGNSEQLDEVGSWDNHMNTPTDKPAINTDELLKHIEGMEVSVDVSTCDADAGHRYFGTVTEISELDTARNGYILLVQDAKPNFKPDGNSPATPDGWQLVPKEPTEAMNKAGWAAMNEHDAINPTYRAMLAAAPQQDVRLALEIGMSRYAGAMQKLVDSGD